MGGKSPSPRPTRPFMVRLDPEVWEQARLAALADRRTVGAEIGVLCTEALAARAAATLPTEAR
jgi:hypothetical protein